MVFNPLVADVLVYLEIYEGEGPSAYGTGDVSIFSNRVMVVAAAYHEYVLATHLVVCGNVHLPLMEGDVIVSVYFKIVHRHVPYSKATPVLGLPSVNWSFSKVNTMSSAVTS